MPHPNDLLSVREIAVALNISWATVADWAVQRYIKPAGKKQIATKDTGGKRTVNAYHWSDVLALKRVTGRINQDVLIKLMPKGYMMLDEAAVVLNHSKTYIRSLARTKKLQSVRVEWPCNSFTGKPRCSVFVLRKAVEAMAAARAESNWMKGGPIEKLYVPENPLIAADNELCLQARRELWENRGRIFGFPLAAARECG